MNVGVAEAAGVDFDDDLIGAGLGGFPLFYFPLAVYRGNHCCFHGRTPGRNLNRCSVWMLVQGCGCRKGLVCRAIAGKGRLDGLAPAEGGEEDESSFRSTGQPRACSELVEGAVAPT